MLVSLGTNQAIGAGASVTLPYACKSVQKVFIKIDDSTGSNAFNHSITIQLGQRTIANGCLGYGLLGMSTLQSHCGAGGFRTLLVTCLFPVSYKYKNPEVKHRSNILSR